MLEIYCDGAYSPSRKMGGWAIVVLENGIKIDSQFAPFSNTTNNQMEILAVIQACSWLKNNNKQSATIYTDSMYVVGTMTLGWKKNTNHNYWELLLQVSQGLDLTWKHVKGHSNNKYNELCDALAVSASHVTLI